MEYFELTFFCPKGEYKEESVDVIEKQLKGNYNFGRESFVEFFSDKEKGYSEFRLNISDFKITKETFNNVIEYLSQFVSVIFTEMHKIEIATGVYELTYYLVSQEKKWNLSDFDSDFMKKFPIVFYRAGHEFDHENVVFSDENVICVFHKDAQNIF